MEAKTLQLTQEQLYILCEKFIDENYNRYFRCRSLVDDIISATYDVSLSHIIHSDRQLESPYYKERRKLHFRLNRILRKLNEEGKIEHYSKTVWKKIGEKKND